MTAPVAAPPGLPESAAGTPLTCRIDFDVRYPEDGCLKRERIRVVVDAADRETAVALGRALAAAEACGGREIPRLQLDVELAVISCRAAR